MAKKESSKTREVGPNYKPLKSKSEAVDRDLAVDKKLADKIETDANYMGKGTYKGEYPMKSEYTMKDVEDVAFSKGGKVSSASKRADGCAVKGKTKGKMV